MAQPMAGPAVRTPGAGPLVRCAPDASREELIRAICTYLHLHYQREDLSLSFLSGRVYFSATYLSSLFRRCTGKSFKSYLVELRMEKACELLRTTELYVYQVARETGYPNSQYFSVAFRRHTGCSPSEYRERFR